MDTSLSSDSRTLLHLDKDWYFRQGDEPNATYLPTQGFPTEIHLDLLHHDLIPDPFVGKHEKDIQWVGEKPWIYRTKFCSPNALQSRKTRSTFIVFEGLDTYATVLLNGKTIVKSENMFLPARVDVSESLIDSEDNVLEIFFESAFLMGEKLLDKDPSHKWGCWNGDPSRLAVRKAQYHWSWDWGICCMTCGPWKPIYLETFVSRISDLHIRTTVDESLSSATVNVEMEYDGHADQAKFDLSIDGEHVASSIEALNPCQRAKASLWTRKPKLWYPRQYGNQPLYVLTSSLLMIENGEPVVLDNSSKRFGIRRARVVQRGLIDAPGTSFFFEINNFPLFCGGSNWIPAHNFQTLLNPQKYRDWVKLAADGNQVMLRVWGGGIYEQDAFYDACDEMGILVWQDFAFACGNYPANTHFRNLVEKEAVANVKRLRHHPCIVLWAGNNEDYQYRESEGLDYDPKDKDPADWLESSFPARYIYEKILKDVTAELVPDTYYHFGSPYGGKETCNDPTVGDIHQWNVWHGSQSRYQDFDKLSGRFVSEFGMEAFPSMRTIDKCLTDGRQDIDRYPQSSTIEFHNKAAGNERRLALYLAENIRYTLEPFEHYVYCTQLIQAEAISTAYRLWKRQWKGPEREYCAGTLVWQLNDCWPGISWSIVDYYLRPKLAYFAVKREMEPVTIGMKRTVRKIPANKYTHAYFKIVHELELWACNLTTTDSTAIIEFKSYNFTAEALAKGEGTRQLAPEFHGEGIELQAPTKLPSSRSIELFKCHIPVSREDANEEAQTVVYAELRDPKHKTLIARAFNWPEPLKHVHLSKPRHLRLELSMGGGDNMSKISNTPDWWHPPNNVCALLITSDVPLKGVQIEIEDDTHVCFGDQGFDIMANEPFAVWVWGLGVKDERRISLKHLGT